MTQHDQLILKGRDRDIGGLVVRRVLPSMQRRACGPFVFFDHFGPVGVDAQHAMDVRAHPHIGLATVTYLFSGHGFHRDSLGSRQVISAGDLNWMTAGRGIVHSERTPPEDRLPGAGQIMHGLQVWVGLPVEHEETAPSFVHWGKSKLPDLKIGSLDAKLLLGTYGNTKSPVATLSPTFFMDMRAASDAAETLAFGEREIALYVVDGDVTVDEQVIPKLGMVFVKDPSRVHVRAAKAARVVAIGGAPFPEPRHMWWNFVSSRKERIRQAADDWQHQRMGQVVDETEFIPLPNDPLPK